jgi:hypothetical protein
MLNNEAGRQQEIIHGTLPSRGTSGASGTKKTIGSRGISENAQHIATGFIQSKEAVSVGIKRISRSSFVDSNTLS